MATGQNISTGEQITVPVITQDLGNAGFVPIATPDTTKLNAGNLGNAAPVPYTEPTPTPAYPVASLDTSVTAPTALTAPEQKASDLNTRLQALNDSLTGQAEFRAQQEATQGLPELQKTQTDLSARLKTIQNEAQAIPLQLQQNATGKGITAGGLVPIQTAALRNNAIQALSTSSLLEASRGNITTAQSLVDRAVAQKFDPINEEIKAKTANLNLILQSPEYSLAEKDRAQKQLDVQNTKAAEAKTQEEAAKAIMTTATEAAKNGADALTLKKISEAKTPAEALQIAATAGAITGTKETVALMTKYPDAGILPTDSIKVAQSKLLKSPLYQKSIGGGEKIPTGYTYVTTPAERDALKAQGRTVTQIGGKTYVAPTKVIKGLRGSYTIVDSITNKPVGNGQVKSSTGGSYSSPTISYPSFTSTGINVTPKTTSVEQVGNDILSKTGLSLVAFNYLTQGTSALTRMSSTERQKVMNEAQKFVEKSGTSVQTLKSEYEAYNKTLSNNIQRFNNTKIAESELSGTLQNLGQAVTDAELGNVRVENVLKVMAGEQINDPTAQKIAFHMGQLKNEFALYLAAAQGKSSPDVIDNQEADKAIKNGLSKRSIAALEEAINNSTDKMKIVLQGSVDSARSQVDGLFGVKTPVKKDEIKKTVESTPQQKLTEDYLKGLPVVKQQEVKNSVPISNNWWDKTLNFFGLK